MKIGVGTTDGRRSLFVIEENQAYDIAQLVPQVPVELPQFLAQDGLEHLKTVIQQGRLMNTRALPIEAVVWLSPIRPSQKVLAAAVNYRTHGAEAGVGRRRRWSSGPRQTSRTLT